MYAYPGFSATYSYSTQYEYDCSSLTAPFDIVGTSYTNYIYASPTRSPHPRPRTYSCSPFGNLHVAQVETSSEVRQNECTGAAANKAPGGKISRFVISKQV